MRPATASVTDFAQFAQLRADARKDSPEALHGAAQQFEALMMQQMLKSMRAASLGDDVLGGEQTGFYQDMFDAQLAQHLAAGRGLGVADLLVRQLRGGAPAEATATDSASMKQTAPAGAPLGRDRSEYAVQEESRPRGAPAGGLPSTSGREGEPGIPLRAPANGTPDPVSTPSTPADFVRSILPHAERAAAELGIPARVLVAQAALETGWGRHAIRRADGQQALNFFGIKADKRWEGDRVQAMTHEYADGRRQAESADFRRYASVGAAFEDYVNFLRDNPRYAQALRHGGDARRFVGGLQKAGYATDPAYAQKILRIADGLTMEQALAEAASAPRTGTRRTITV